jgi:hypothetical protein
MLAPPHERSATRLAEVVALPTRGRPRPRGVVVGGLLLAVVYAASPLRGVDADGGIRAMVAGAIAAATAAVLATAGFRLLRRWRRAEGRPGRVTWKVEALSVLAIGVATPLWSTVSRAGWRHVVADLALALAILATTCATDRDRPMERRARSACVASVAALVVAWVRPAFGPLGLHDRFGEAVWANLISPGRGALVYSAVVAVGAFVAWRLGGVLARASVAAGVGAVAVLLTVSAHGSGWWGGAGYGPRLMTEAILVLVPVALAGLLELVEQRREAGSPGLIGAVAALALVASISLHGVGAWSSSAREWSHEPQVLASHPARVWDWDDAPFLRPFRSS